MIPDEGTPWPVIGGVAVLLAVAVLGGLALSNAGPAGTAVATQSNDTDWNTTNGSEAVAPGCPPADALRKEVFDGLETRSIEEVRSTIPSEAVRCLPEDVLETLNLGNETDGSTTGSDGNESDGTDSSDEADSTGDCPPPETIRLEVDAALADDSRAEVRAELTDAEIDCLPADVKDDLNIGDDGSASESATDGTDSTAGDGTDGVDCPSDETIRESVETALAGSSAATVREKIPDEYDDCLPADVKDDLNMGASASADSTATDTATATESDAGTETATATDGGVDCPPAETVRKDVNRTLEKMSAAQFRTMVPEKYVECFPPDVRERLGLTGERDAASGGDAQSSGSEESAAGSSTPMGDPESEVFDSDGDGVVNARDHAPNDASVQFADSDGDGVPDPYDYAPRDPDVQDEGDVAAAADPGGDDGGGDGSGDSIPVAAGSALLLVLAAGTGAVVYRRYGGTGSDDDGLPQPTGTGSTMAEENSSEPHDVFGESAFDPDDSPGTGAAFTFDDHEGDAGGFVFDNETDEDVITLDSDGSVPDEETETGFVFEGGPSAELDDAGEPADD
ncbi:hypothetical protein ACOZ4N_13880 [Halorientalis pallida]|uniref:hypothetical protein n=1 Tax=Halorientalis pallida TaxID=2479928 RepID=UPI003C70491A